MNEKKAGASTDPCYHTANLKKMLTEVIEHARADVAKIADPKSQALFETTAEVLADLRKAFEDYEQRNDSALKAGS